VDSAYYDPKSRSMRDNPNPEAEDADYGGDNFARISGDAVGLADTQLLSGFVWDDRGHIVTNYHVVRNAQSAQVAILTKVGDDKSRLMESSSVTRAITSMRPSVAMTDYKRSVYKARVVGADPGKDICVLKVDALDGFTSRSRSNGYWQSFWAG
jgi:S1-C subfamily serine protease